MARPRRSRRRRPVTRTQVTTQRTLTVGGFGGHSGDSGALAQRVYEAATVIAEAAKADAAAYPSEQIPDSIHVGQGSPYSATVYADSPNARPIELGLRHPLFGNRGFWYTMEQRRFLENGAVTAGDAAAEIIARVIDDWAMQAGFR